MIISIYRFFSISSLSQNDQTNESLKGKLLPPNHFIVILYSPPRASHSALASIVILRQRSKALSTDCVETQ